MSRKNLASVIGDKKSRGTPLKGEDDWDSYLGKKHGSPNDTGWKDYQGGGSGGKGGYKYAPSCYTTHPPLPLPGTDKVIYGGNCSTPTHKDAEVYVGLCSTMRMSPRSWPWKVGTEFLFEIPDMSVPASSDEFKKLIAYLKKEVDAGHKVHVGCIGGHGRTGMTLAALVSLYGEPDAITYVRKHYCQKAVESSSQIKFLETHFGIKPVKGSKSNFEFGNSGSTKGFSEGASGGLERGQSDYIPLTQPNSIWD